jgi:ubiquitin-protein ligase
MRTILFFLLCLTASNTSIAQINDISLRSDKFDAINVFIKNFLSEKEKDTNTVYYYIVGLTNDYKYPLNADPLKFASGIYKFGINSSHAEIYILIVGKKQSFLLRNYSLNNVLEHFIAYNKKVVMKKDLQVEVVKNMIEIVSLH